MNDEKLALFYYGDELDEADRQHIADRLQHDPAFAARYEAFQKRMRDLDQIAPARATAAAKARWHAVIDSAAHSVTQEPDSSRPAIRRPGAIWGLAVAAALVIGIGLGSQMSSRDNGIGTTPTVDTTNLSPAEFERRSFERLSRGLQVHLRDSREQVDSGQRNTLLIMDIVEQNRLFERAAEDTGSDDLARVLRAFEPILLQLADESVSPTDAEALRAQLSFELNVMLTKLRRDTSDSSQTI